jgi:hypothetical protein
MNQRMGLVLGCMLALTACGSGHQDETSATAAPPPGTHPVQISKSNVFSPLVQDLNKAKALNGQVQQQAKTSDQSIENDTAPAAATASGP